jgi:hypothetical protein
VLSFDLCRVPDWSNFRPLRTSRPRAGRSRYQETGKDAGDCDGSGTNPTDAIAGHGVEPDGSGNWQQEGDPDCRTDLGRRVEYARGDTAISGVSRICSSLGGGHRSYAESHSHNRKGHQELDYGQTIIRQE